MFGKYKNKSYLTLGEIKVCVTQMKPATYTREEFFFLPLCYGTKYGLNAAEVAVTMEL